MLKSKVIASIASDSLDILDRDSCVKSLSYCALHTKCIEEYEKILSELKPEKIKKWKFIMQTPAGGSNFFNDSLDMCAIVYSSKIKIYYNRTIEGFTPSCFTCVSEIVLM